MPKKIKVVWLTCFSNTEVRCHLHYRLNILETFVRKITGTSFDPGTCDYSPWITNGINEFRKYKEQIELHVITCQNHIDKQLYEFISDDISYHVFKNEGAEFLTNIARKVFPRYQCKFKRNSKLINNIINRINPDILHLIGPENPECSRGFSEYKGNAVKMTMLQTLMSEPGFCENYPIKHSLYKFRVEYEQKAFLSADYICTDSIIRAKFIKDNIKPNGTILNHRLPMGLDNIPEVATIKKTFDFVYFGSLDKAFDMAIEAFIIAKRSHPEITLNAIGPCSTELKSKVMRRIKEEEIEGSVVFDGMLPTHEDVLKHIQRSRYALLPLKVDYISTTLLESMALGLPVVTTITKGTPTLNLERESIMLSPIGDYNAMADNMCILIESDQLREKLKDNAFKTVSTQFNNAKNINRWVLTYEAIYNGCSLNEFIIL